MRKKTFFAGIYVLTIFIGATGPGFAQQVRYGAGSWNAESLGNHRAVLSVPQKADAVRAHIEWRRRDTEPEKKNIIVIEAATSKKITNVLRVNVNRSYGDIVFQAESPGTYYVYYLPYTSQGRNYPKVAYQPPEDTADAVWKAAVESVLRSGAQLPWADLVEIQSIDEFNSFYPMEVIATPEEVGRLVASHANRAFLLFPEDRSNPIRMTGDLPQKWVLEEQKQEFAGDADRGEFYAFQIGLFASTADIKDIAAHFSNLRTADGSHSIPSSAMRCVNTGGVNWDGAVFKKVVPVKKGQVQALWFGVQIPEDAAPGTYRGQMTIAPVGMPAQSVNLAITVGPNLIADSGDDEPWRHSRLRWLDSQLAVDDEIVCPYTPMRVAQGTISILGRKVVLHPSGLPARIQSFFTPDVTRIEDKAKSLLAAPMELIVEDAAGRRLKWIESAAKFTKQNDGIAEWKATSISGPLKMDVSAAMEFDGFMQFKVTLSALKAVDVSDIRLEIPLVKEAVQYMMGLGLKGGYRPASYQWAWDVTKNQDGAWLGDANAGLQFSLRAENYSRPLNTNFYQSKPLNMPPSWFNGGKGGITIRESTGGTVLVSCYGGSRTLQPGKDLHFDFNLLVTPFHTLDTKSQWSVKFFHSFQPVDNVIRSGANTINVHHGNDVNPYLNYPFLHPQQMKAYIDEAHRKGLKVKIYDTIRELSNHAPELFALRSLGSEIFSEGPGDGFSWLQEHVGSNYIAAWFVPALKDAAIINSGMSRWHNYYVEGLNWLVNKMQIDGLYIDDVAFDRTTMKRVRKVLDRGRPEAIIDLHSANQYNPRDGFANSANLYLEHFPYINRLWFGEYFDPNSPADFWFVEMSGIPYGLMGEMLQDGGNKWRGMVYGMTNRMPYDSNDPSPIWKARDDFGIQTSDMIGYWSPRCPVKTDNKDVLATAYVGRGKTLVAIGSWAQSDVNVRLSIDWRALGIDPAKAILTAPEVRDFQPASRFSPNDPIPVDEAAEHARRSLDSNRFNIPALSALEIAQRKLGQKSEASKTRSEILEIDPLNHFAAAEEWIANASARSREQFTSLIRSELPHETYLELACFYARIGLAKEAIEILQLSPSHPMVDYWLAYLTELPERRQSYLEKAAQASPMLVFPFRDEDLPVLRWALSEKHDWKTLYYLALILWSKGRLEEAAGLLEECKNVPDFGPFYLARAELRRRAGQEPAIDDFRRAWELAPDQWRTWLALARRYSELHLLKEALGVLKTGFSKFPENFALGMEYARALIDTNQYQAALDDLDRLEVLPYEGASEGRVLYEKAHLLLAGENIRNKKYEEALAHIAKSRQWPEHLGVGKPYNPDERLQDVMERYCRDKLSDRTGPAINSRELTKLRADLQRTSPWKYELLSRVKG